MTTFVETQTIQPATLSLADFVRDFGPALREAVDQQNPPVFHPEDTCPLRDAVMDGLLRQPFPAQREVVQAVSALLFDQGEKAAIINAEMGTGKTQMAICASAVAQAEGYQRALVICPPHLVYKWRREIKETVPNARVWVLNGADTLARLLQLRQWMKDGNSDVPEFFVMGRVRMRLGYEWKHAFARKRIIGRNGDGQEQDVYAYDVLACPKCGTPYRNEDGDTYRSERFLPEKRLSCQHRHVDSESHTQVCGEQLWSLVRKEALKDKRKLVMDALKKLPTIGDKTAERLVSTFGEDMLGDMLSDNLYEVRHEVA